MPSLLNTPKIGERKHEIQLFRYITIMPLIESIRSFTKGDYAKVVERAILRHIVPEKSA